MLYIILTYAILYLLNFLSEFYGTDAYRQKEKLKSKCLIQIATSTTLEPSDN